MAPAGASCSARSGADYRFRAYQCTPLPLSLSHVSSCTPPTFFACEQTGAFTPVETTELGEISRLLPEFEDRKAKVIGLCCATAEEFDAWAADAMGLTG
jgi:alkyl hydroperoxide reductase subunit AhpC